MSSLIKNVITGGAGFIGSHLIDKLLEDGESVVCIDNFYSGNQLNIEHLTGNPKFKFIYHDLLEPLNEDIRCEKVWHLACPASPTKYLENTLLTSKVNYIGTLNMLEFARKQRAKFFFASSSEIYGSTSTYPQKEDSLIAIQTNSLRSCYSEGKRIAESLCYDYKRIYGLQIRIARIFNTYGPRLTPDDGRVISNFINRGLKDRPITIYGNGSQTRTFTYIEDIIDGICLLMNSNYFDPVNLGGVEEISINDLAQLIMKILAKDLKIQYEFNSDDNVIRRKPDITFAMKNLNWYPKEKLIDGLKKTISFSRENIK